jgi:hypothetical protein
MQMYLTKKKKQPKPKQTKKNLIQFLAKAGIYWKHMHYIKKDPKILCARFDKGSNLYSGI